MMKKILLVVGGLALFLGGIPSNNVNAEGDAAAGSLPTFCGYTPPVSCFYANSSGSESTKLGRPLAEGGTEDIAPAHCTTTSPYKELETSKPIEEICNMLDIEECNVTNIQSELKDECGGGEKGCYPLGETITDPDTGNEVTCSDHHFSDGKYGLCTEESVNRFVKYKKGNDGVCDTPPTLTIDGADNITIGKAWSGTVKQSGGVMFTIDENFVLNEIANPEVTDIQVKMENCMGPNDKNSPITAKAGEQSTFVFSNASPKCTLTPTGTVKERSSLPPKIVKKIVNVEALTEKTSEKVEDPEVLSCKQGLLPKYLVGANCKSELKGDASDVTYWIQKFSKQITTFIAAVAVLLIAWNAFGLVLAAGDSDKIATAKKALIWVGAGLLLIAFAYIIVKTAISITFLQ